MCQSVRILTACVLIVRFWRFDKFVGLVPPAHGDQVPVRKDLDGVRALTCWPAKLTGARCQTVIILTACVFDKFVDLVPPTHGGDVPVRKDLDDV